MKFHGCTRHHQNRDERRAHAGGAAGAHRRAFCSWYADGLCDPDDDFGNGAAFLEPGWVTLGTEVDIRHLAASPVGALVRTTARVIAVQRRVIRFEVEAFDGERRIGEGRHARGLVNLAKFIQRVGAR
jgi:hypothetical protein